ncbi:MAG TPA: hypothetical protein VF171_04200 [Trueperaceae bacterium]
MCPVAFRLALAGSLLVALAACLPTAQQNDRPDVAVVGGPTENRVPGLADDLQELLLQEFAPLPYDFIDRRIVAFQETHREMHGARAPLQAAFIARAFGGELSVLVGAPLYRREVEGVQDAFGDKRVVTTIVQVHIAVVEPRHALVIAALDSGIHRSVRFEPAELPLLPLSEDPGLKRDRREALQDVAGPLAAQLSSLLAATCSNRAGSAGTPPGCAPR